MTRPIAPALRSSRLGVSRLFSNLERLFELRAQDDHPRKPSLRLETLEDRAMFSATPTPVLPWTAVSATATAGTGDTGSHTYDFHAPVQVGDLNNQDQKSGAAGLGYLDLRTYVSNDPANCGGQPQMTATLFGGYPGYTYRWNFGDGSTGTGSDPHHVFPTPQPGAVPVTYSVTINATDVYGNTVGGTFSVHLRSQIVLTGTGPKSVEAGSNANFSASATGGDPGYNYHWDFGDGSSADGAIQAHAYSPVVNANYTATVTVTDKAGDSASVSGIVTVTSKTTTTLTTSDPTAVYGKSVTLTASVTANSPAAGVPSGTVTFFDGQTILGVGTLSGGMANLTAKLNAGTHAIRAVYGGTPQWSGSSSDITQTIAPAPLVVVANDQYKDYGAEVPTLTYSSTGFVDNDSPGLITGTPATDATPDSDPGDYLILQGTLAAGPNYTIDFYPGTLTVFQKPDDPVKSLNGQIAFKGISTSSAEGAKFTPKDGEERMSSKAEVESMRPHFMKYDGPTEFKADYKIGLKQDGSFDPTKSEITLTTVNYSSRNYLTRKSTEVSAEEEAAFIKAGNSVYRNGDYAYIFSKPEILKEGWKTLSIPITKATLKDGKIQSFEFLSDAWYGKRPSGIIDKGIVGEIDLATGKANFTAKYQIASNGVIATYVVAGIIKK